MTIINAILIIIVIGSVIATLVLLIAGYRRNVMIDLPQIWQAFDTVEKSYRNVERSVKEELAKTRTEAAAAAKQSQEELSRLVKDTADTFHQDLDRLRETVDQKLQRVQDDTARKLDQLREDSLASAKNLRADIAKTLQASQDALANNVVEIGRLQKGQLEAFAARLDKQAVATDQKLDKQAGATDQKLDGLKAAVDAQIKTLQKDSANQLEQLRAAVDGKLQGAEKRLAASFQQVSDRAEQIYQRLEEKKS